MSHDNHNDDFGWPYDPESSVPRDVVLAYLDMMWNRSDPEACRRYVGEYQWRHDFGNSQAPVQRLHIDENVKRTRDAFKVAPRQKYRVKLLTEQDGDVCVIWEAVWLDCMVPVMEKLGYKVEPDRSVQMAGIEVFRVRDGRIVEIWNAYAPSIVTWGEVQTA